MRGGGLVAQRPHDANPRLVRCASWSLYELWTLTALFLVHLFAPEGRIDLLTDDTLLQWGGRKIEGAGVFRDAGRSGGKNTVFDRGLNLIPLTLRVRPPWGGEPLALPLAMRLYRKHAPTHLDLVARMVQGLVDLFPDRPFHLIADRAYAPLAGWKLPCTQVTSRLRKDVALYALPAPPRAGQVGRPRKKRGRLHSPEAWARRTKQGWKRTWVDRRAKMAQRLLQTRDALWYHVCPDQLVRVVVSRDPKGREKGDAFFTTDLTLAPGAAVSHYFGRWPVELLFREAKGVFLLDQVRTKNRYVAEALIWTRWLPLLVSRRLQNVVREALPEEWRERLPSRRWAQAFVRVAGDLLNMTLARLGRQWVHPQPPAELAVRLAARALDPSISRERFGREWMT